MSAKEIKDVRYVEFRGIRYLRADDVSSLIQQLAGTESTDTRKRFNELAQSLTKDD